MVDPLKNASFRMAMWTKQVHPESSTSVEYLQYGILLFILPLSVVSSALMISFLSDTFTNTVLAILTISSMRYLTGGKHFNNLTICFFFSLFVICGIATVSIEWFWIQYACSGISIVLVLLYAPANSRMQKYPLFVKGTTLLCIGIGLILKIDTIIYGIFIQCISLIPIHIRR